MAEPPLAGDTKGDQVMTIYEIEVAEFLIGELI